MGLYVFLRPLHPLPPPPVPPPAAPLSKTKRRETASEETTNANKRGMGRISKKGQRCSIIKKHSKYVSANHLTLLIFSNLFWPYQTVTTAATPIEATLAKPFSSSEATKSAPGASTVENSNSNYASPKFVIPVHRTHWAKPVTPSINKDENNNSTGRSGKTGGSDANQPSVNAAKKSVYERDVNFVESVGGKPGEGFYITLDIGSPPQRLNVLLDTGSSNFAVAGHFHVGVDHFFDRRKSLTLTDLGQNVRVVYSQGDWEGDLVSDLVSLDTSVVSSLAASRAPFALITSSTNFFLKHAKWEGILGLAYPSLSRPDRNQPSFVDLIVRKNQLDNVFALQLCSGTSFESNGGFSPSTSGHLAVGGADSNAFRGNMFFTPIVREMYYEVVVADVDVGGESIQVPCGVYNNQRTIVDSGTTNLLLPHAAHSTLMSALQRATSSPFWSPIPEGFWRQKNLICVSRGTVDFDSFPVIGISLFASGNENQAFRLQFRPEQYLRAVGDYGLDGNCYKLSIGASGDADSKSGTVLGAVLMEGFYVVFDKAEKKIGWAQGNCGRASGGAITSSLTPPRIVDVNVTYCKAPTRFTFINNNGTNQRLMIASYVLGGIAVFLLIIIIFLIVEPILFRRKATQDRMERNQGNYEQLD